MAAFTMTDVSIYAGALDASCFGNSVSFDQMVDTVDATTFCSGGWKQPIASLKGWSAQLQGPQDLAVSTASTTYGPDEYYALNVGSIYPLAMVPAGAAERAVAYFGQGMLSEYSPVRGSIGDLAEHTSQWTIASDQLVRGVYATKTTTSTPGTAYGTSHNLGAVSATQRVYASIHVLTRGGTGTLAVELISDDNSGFTTPTTRATFTAVSSRTAEFKSVAGAIADTWWGLSLTVGGGSPSFQVRGFIGIQ